MPLTMASAGVLNTVKRITGKDDTKRFLASLGFVEGGTVMVVNELGGNIIVSVKDSRIALDKTMANRIIV
jgi:Fe2+ transport system protein A